LLCEIPVGDPKDLQPVFNFHAQKVNSSLLNVKYALHNVL
jgi:hypothetical protein